MFMSPNPSANLKRQDEADATDMIYSDTPAINGGEKCAHILIGKKSKLTDAYKVKSGSSEDFLETLQDRVSYRGCPTGLEADNAPMYLRWKNSQYLLDISILKNIDDQLQEELKVKAKAKAHQLQEEADAYFFESNEQQTGHFNTAPSVVPVTSSSLPKRPPPTGPKRHVKPKKLRRPKSERSNSKRLQDMNVNAMNALMTTEVLPEQNLPLSTDRHQEHVTDINHPTNPRPFMLTSQQVLKNHSFVYLRENGENENPIWQEFEFPLEDKNGNWVMGEDGKPMVVIAPPPSDLVGRVFLTKPNERGEVN
ncbi:hypothetical protein FRACYDRAFT_247235 [Fragilariopsis cylindrus CCMP1102]|uniref:Integrase catalytic domain-containing protein n=1 Tax=Fragilariopsis cylindrus CCMP1102 TaxID=635003 RepID=A0A1E7EWQ9_9STRA|nr:hypothetical protein FRACYDRAFT_247235 [Fragilariopsis cylindrus CCMP1102]|eukprot:OEU10296.1 hypothetical protein FRACYDRAFT_247235 [Fragilariopsis cylindrus CCMP1102]